MSKGRNKQRLAILAAGLLTLVPAAAQQRLTLDDCREMALQASKDLEQARTQVEMAGYDRKIALANYFPNVSATGAYMYNNRDIALVDEFQSSMLQSAGSLMQGVMEGAAASMQEQVSGAMSQAMTGTMTRLMTAIQSNPALAQEYMSSPMWQTVLGMLQNMDPSSLMQLQLPDISEPVNAIGADIDKALHPDLHNIWLGVVSVQQPVFVGGKIVYSNKMAALAEDLAQSRYDLEETKVVLDVDQAYWQIVSIAGKKRLSESYADLLHTLQADVDASVRAGVMTESDALQIKVKVNEAEMLRTKATNGLTLAKMLLCQRIGLPLTARSNWPTRTWTSSRSRSVPWTSPWTTSGPTVPKPAAWTSLPASTMRRRRSPVPTDFPRWPSQPTGWYPTRTLSTASRTLGTEECSMPA